MMEKSVIIKNEKGLHVRSAGEFVAKSKVFKSKVEVRFNGRTVNGESVMMLITLGAKKGQEITIATEGEDAELALSALVELVENGFGEE